MSNNKQSSVEWFAQESWKLRIELEGGKISLGEYANKYYQLKEQAKAMHRKEILEARQNGLDNGFVNGNWDSQLYYELEFGGNNEQQ